MNPEQMVVGACLLDGSAFRFAAKHITPDDFADPRLGQVFSIIASMATLGEPVEPGLVALRMAERGVRGITAVDLHSLVAGVASSASAEFYAEQVRELSIRRQLRIAAARLTSMADDPTAPTARTITEHGDVLRRIQEGQGGDLGVETLGEMLEGDDEDDWLVEGLFRAGDRMIITGQEGLGKSTWIRQMSIQFAAGINPVTLDLIDPLRVLVVDVENSRSQWRYESRAMAHNAAEYGRADPRLTMRVKCSGRIDITSANTLGWLHRLVDEHAPHILFIGPLYKLVPHGINNDDDAAPLITALDSLRDRGLVMVMEGHSPKGGVGDRDLTPRGSAALMGWPEFGFGLAQTSDTRVVDVKRWRGDRDRRRQWPQKLWKGDMFPWVAENANQGRLHRADVEMRRGWQEEREARE